MVHCGSRGFGYQICDDYLAVMGEASAKYGIALPDRQLACAPSSRPREDGTGRHGLRGQLRMGHRQMIMHLGEAAFMRAMHVGPRDLSMRLVYDVAHNIAKLESHQVGGESVATCVHRRGNQGLRSRTARTPGRLCRRGTAVLIPGDMGTASYVCRGSDEAMTQTFGSTCHGAGRAMSRAQALRRAKGRAITRSWSRRGYSSARRAAKLWAKRCPKPTRGRVDRVVE